MFLSFSVLQCSTCAQPTTTACFPCAWPVHTRTVIEVRCHVEFFFREMKMLRTFVRPTCNAADALPKKQKNYESFCADRKPIAQNDSSAAAKIFTVEHVLRDGKSAE